MKAESKNDPAFFLPTIHMTIIPTDTEGYLATNHLKPSNFAL